MHGKAAKTIRQAACVLSAVMRQARDWGYVETNSVRDVKLPPNRAESERRALSAAEFNQLIAKLAEPGRTMALLAAFAGMRIGEILALRWEHVDFLGGMIKVRQSVYEGQITRPKTRSAERDIPMAEPVANALKQWRAANTGVAGNSFLFPSEAGTPFESSAVLKRFLKPAAKAADYRASAGTRCVTRIARGLKTRAHPRVAQTLLGHADVQTTLNIYTHTATEEQRAAINSLLSLFPSVPHRSVGFASK
jgi:integrase